MKKTEHSNHEERDEIPVIYRYTRQQAIEDGVLIDLTAWAKETGFTVPVACTASVWHQYITPPPNTAAYGQSQRGRAHDLLWMLYLAIRRRQPGTSQDDAQILFEVIFLQAPQRQETVRLKAVCGPGDQGEMVITVMLPQED